MVLFIRPLLVLGLCLPLANQSLSQEKRLDIVVFLSDDHGQKDSTPYGATDVRTPNMQRLANLGTRFTHAFVASPSCAPSRSAMLTGRMPARNGAEANHTFKRPEIPSLVDHLKKFGYEVAAFGKVAHGKGASRYGFDVIRPEHDLPTIEKYLRERDTTRPLCLFVGTHDPHVPWEKNAEYDPKAIQLPPHHLDTPETRENRARYYTDVTTADRELGEVFDLTQRLLDPQKTLFIYSSDHGGQWPFGKWNLYDAGIQIPLIAVWPGVIRPNQTSDAMVQWIDLLPTLIDAAGGDVPQEIDGKSFLKVLQGNSKSHREEIYTTHQNDGTKNIYPIRSLRTRNFKYIHNLYPHWAHTTHIDQGGGSGDGWRYFHEWIAAAKSNPQASMLVDRYYRRPREELYDLQQDPFELHNLADNPAHADRLAEMRSKLDAWRKEQGDISPITEEPRLLSNTRSWEPFRHPDMKPTADGNSSVDQDLEIANELIALVQKQAKDWNEGKIDRFMDAYWNDERLTFASGGKITRGWIATRDRYRTKYPTPEKMGKLTFSELEVQKTSDSTALMLGRWNLDREQPVGGNFSLVWQKTSGSWRIIHDHTSLSE